MILKGKWTTTRPSLTRSSKSENFNSHDQMKVKEEIKIRVDYSDGSTRCLMHQRFIDSGESSRWHLAAHRDRFITVNHNSRLFSISSRVANASPRMSVCVEIEINGKQKNPVLDDEKTVAKKKTASQLTSFTLNWSCWQLMTARQHCCCDRRNSYLTTEIIWLGAIVIKTEINIEPMTHLNRARKEHLNGICHRLQFHSHIAHCTWRATTQKCIVCIITWTSSV